MRLNDKPEKTNMSSVEPEIRAPKPDEFDVFFELQDALFGDDVNALDEAGFKAKIHDDHENFIAAFIEGRLAGFVVLTNRSWRPWTGIDFVAVDPAFQGLGIGTVLVKHAISVCRRPVLRLFVRPSNTGAKRLYEKLGFIVTGRRKENYDDGEDAIIMMRSFWSKTGLKD